MKNSNFSKVTALMISMVMSLSQICFAGDPILESLQQQIRENQPTKDGKQIPEKAQPGEIVSVQQLRPSLDPENEKSITKLDAVKKPAPGEIDPAIKVGLVEAVAGKMNVSKDAVTILEDKTAEGKGITSYTFAIREEGAEPVFKVYTGFFEKKKNTDPREVWRISYDMTSSKPTELVYTLQATLYLTTREKYPDMKLNSFQQSLPYIQTAQLGTSDKYAVRIQMPVKGQNDIAVVGVIPVTSNSKKPYAMDILKVADISANGTFSATDTSYYLRFGNGSFVMPREVEILASDVNNNGIYGDDLEDLRRLPVGIVIPSYANLSFAPKLGLTPAEAVAAAFGFSPKSVTIVNTGDPKSPHQTYIVKHINEFGEAIFYQTRITMTETGMYAVVHNPGQDILARAGYDVAYQAIALEIARQMSGRPTLTFEQVAPLVNITLDRAAGVYNITFPWGSGIGTFQRSKDGKNVVYKMKLKKPGFPRLPVRP